MSRAKNQVAFCVLAFLLSGCLLTPSRCPIKDLVLTGEDLPDGAIMDEITSFVDGPPGEVAQRSFNLNRSFGFHEVGRFTRLKYAQEEYEADKERIFDVTEHYGPWEIPDTLKSVIENADQYEVACDFREKEVECRYIGLYDRYKVYLKMDNIYPRNSLVEDFRDLLIAIDQKMGDCAYEEPRSIQTVSP